MVNVLMTALYFLAVVASLPAAFFIGYSGYKPENFKNWRLARTCFVTMVSALTGMFFLLRAGEAVTDGWAAFILFSVIMFSVPLGMYGDAWMRRPERFARKSTDQVRYAKTNPVTSEL